MDKDLRTLPIGTISVGNINTELGTSGKRSLGQADGRTLSGVTTGKISLGDYQGKVNEVDFEESLAVSLFATFGKTVVSSTLTVSSFVTASWNVKGNLCTESAQTTSNRFGSLVTDNVQVGKQTLLGGMTWKCINVDYTQALSGTSVSINTTLVNNGDSPAKGVDSFETKSDCTMKVFGKRYPGFSTKITLGVPGEGVVEEIFIHDIGTIKASINKCGSGNVTGMRINEGYTLEDSYILSEAFDEYIFNKYENLKVLYFTVKVLKTIHFDPYYNNGMEYNSKLKLRSIDSDSTYFYYLYDQMR